MQVTVNERDAVQSVATAHPAANGEAHGHGMDKLVIEGGHRLSGEIVVSGAKNAALPILCAGLLTGDPVDLDNVPNLKDVRTTLKVLNQMGVKSETDGCRVQLDASRVDNLVAPYEP